MKKIFWPLLSCFTLALATVSCNKQNAADIAPVSRTVSQNSINPYDNIGELHNQALDYFVATADFNKAIEEAEPKTLDFLEKKGFNRSEMQAVLHDPAVAHITQSKDPIAAAREYYRERGKDAAVAYVDKIKEAMSTATTAEEAVERLTVIEQAAGADPSLDKSDQASLLKGLAIGKSSARYWYAQEKQGKDGSWLLANAGTTGAPTGEPISLRPWWGYGLADLAGSLGPGGLAGGAAASILLWLADHP